MILYELIKRQVNAIHNLEGVAGLPMEVNLNHKILWLGELVPYGLFAVEIREDRTKLGWLYSDNSMVLFRVDGKIYECSIPTLKSLSEMLLKDKQISSTPEENKLVVWSASGGINGFISMEKVLEISNEIA